jgi:hypothetical protein
MNDAAPKAENGSHKEGGGIMGKRHSLRDPKLEAALDELDAILTVDVLVNILHDLPEPHEAMTDGPELLPLADRHPRRGKPKR